MNTILNSSCFENLDEELMLIPVVGGNTGRNTGDQEPYCIFGGEDDDFGDDGFDDDFGDDDDFSDDFDDENYDDDLDDEDDFALEDDEYDSDLL